MGFDGLAVPRPFCASAWLYDCLVTQRALPGYIFLVVDKRSEAKVLEDPELFDALDDKNYNFELPEQIDTYDELRLTEPTDKCACRPLCLVCPQPHSVSW